MTYPTTPGFTEGSETSQSASESVELAAKGQCEWITKYLERKGMFGATMDETANDMKAAGFKNIIKNNVSTRLGSLCALNPPIAYKSSQTRKGKEKGARPQSVYKLDLFRQYETKAPDTVKFGRQSVGNQWLIWSNEHKAWWRGQSMGYTPMIQEAGIYNYEQASSICRKAGRDEIGVPNETMLPWDKDLQHDY